MGGVSSKAVTGGTGKKVVETGLKYLQKEAFENREMATYATSLTEQLAANRALAQNPKDQEAMKQLGEEISEQPQAKMSQGMSDYSSAMADLGGQTDFASQIRAEQAGASKGGRGRK